MRSDGGFAAAPPALAALLACAALHAPAAAHADPARDSMLDRGEILVHLRDVPGSDVPEVNLEAVIDAPPERVWDLVSRCAGYTRTMDRVKASEEVSRAGTGEVQNVVCRVTIDMPFPYSDLTAVTRAVHRTSGGRWTRTWKLWYGDYRVNQGCWDLARFRGSPGRTRVLYRVLAVPKAWIPRWVRETAQKRSLPEMIRKLRRLAASR